MSDQQPDVPEPDVPASDPSGQGAGADVPELVAAERAAEPHLGPAAAAALATVREHWAFAEDGDDLTPEYAALGVDPVYADAAERIVARAAARARAVRAGEVPYVADGAFTPEEAHVVERAVATGLWLDAPWVAAAAATLADVSVAPGSARTLPSQAMCFAVARSMRDLPTPEAVAALTAAATEVRHAGVRKKLARYAGAARRNLAGRPAVALRLPTAGTPTRAQVTAWTRTLEACFTLDPRWPAGTWTALVHGTPATSRVAAGLVWTGARAGSFRGVPGAFVDASGAAVDLRDDDEVRLWHPAAASPAEREAWRAHVWSEQLEQPFRQVFREHYAAVDDGFTGAVVDATQLVGVARTQGWGAEHDVLARTAGGLRAEISTDTSLYPGVTGTARVTGVRVGRAGRHAQPGHSGTVLVPVPADELPTVPVSELLRSVDLVVSTSAVALDGDEEPAERVGASPAGVLALRRAVLEHVLADLDPADAARVRVDGRYAVVGSVRVHLATARVTRDGDRLEGEPVADHGWWAPAGDPLLSRVVGLVAALLRSEGR